jgi:hypothetical protein
MLAEDASLALSRGLGASAARLLRGSVDGGRAAGYGAGMTAVRVAAVGLLGTAAAALAWWLLPRLVERAWPALRAPGPQFGCRCPGDSVRLGLVTRWAAGRIEAHFTAAVSPVPHRPKRGADSALSAELPAAA